MDSVKDKETMELDCIPETNNNNEKQEVLSGKRSLEPTDTNLSCPEMEEGTVVVSASRWCAGVRMWSTLYSVMTASLLSFILGTTLAYSSPTILEFTNPNNRYHFSTTISAIYVVSIGISLGMRAKVCTMLRCEEERVFLSKDVVFL